MHIYSLFHNSSNIDIFTVWYWLIFTFIFNYSTMFHTLQVMNWGIVASFVGVWSCITVWFLRYKKSMIQMVPFRVRKYLFSSTLPVRRFSFLPFLRCLDTTQNKVRQHFPTNLGNFLPMSLTTVKGCYKILKNSKNNKHKHQELLNSNSSQYFTEHEIY